MPIVSGISALLLASAACNAADKVVSDSVGNSVRYSATGSNTRLEIQTPGRARHILRVKRDDTVRSGAEPIEVKLVGGVRNAAIILTDTYPSIPGGLSFCQAGRESFLRIVSVAGRTPVETFRVKLASCHEDFMPAASGVEWLPKSATLRLRWLQGPRNAHKPMRLTLKIGPDGKPK